jgi:hypothetical protein
VVVGEAAARVRYFVMHKHDWNYLTMPWRLSDEAAIDHSTYVPPKASPNQMVFKMGKPCLDREVFSGRFNRTMPYTWDQNCFRGDRITREKRFGEARMFVLGGSTVEDAQADADTWTTRLKESLANSAVTVVNAGQSGMGSTGAVVSYRRKIRQFSPDVVLYYEAWNEQVDFLQWNQVGNSIASMANAIHDAMYYRSALYTYAVEKYYFVKTGTVAGGATAGLGPLSEQFWTIDEDRLRSNLRQLFEAIRASGAKPVFVTQAVNFPRRWKGIDTMDPVAVRRLIDTLQHDRNYAYNVFEISALNQRLAVQVSRQVAEELRVPVVDILPEMESLGESRRASLFMDLGHLTWQGDEFVGPLIAKKLAGLGIVPQAPRATY